MPNRPWKPFVVVLFLALVTPARGEKYPDKWLPVTPEELALTDSAIEPGTDAEALFVKAWVTDDVGTSSRECYVRLKIFTESGAQRYANVDLDCPLKDVTIDNVRARVVQPDGSAVELDKRVVIGETRARRGGRDLLRKSFPLVGVRPGCVIEYRYRRVAMHDEAGFQIYDFQLDVPARVVACHFSPVRDPGLSIRQLKFHTNATTEQDREDAQSYNVVATNQRAYVSEPDCPPEYQVRGWMLSYHSIEKPQAPQDYWREFGRTESDWADRFTGPDRRITDLARGICRGVTGDLPRVRALCEWMRLNFRLLNSAAPETLRAAGVRRNYDARGALRQGVGTGGDAELALIALARGAGLEARLLRVPSRELHFFDERMMSGGFLGSFVAGIRVDGHWRAFDAASRSLPWDMLPSRDEGRSALLCDPDSSRFIETGISEPERSASLTSGTLALDDEGTLEGDLVTTCTGHVNERYRDALEEARGGRADTVFVGALGWNASDIEISRLVLDRGQHEWDPLVIRRHVRMKKGASVIEERLILEPAAMRAREPARFTASSRSQPICFEHGWSERDSIRIRLPEGWKLEAVESQTPVHSEGVADYRCSTLVGDDGRELLHLRSFAFGHGGSLYFQPNDYTAMKQLFDLVHQKDQAIVTFRRASAP